MDDNELSSTPLGLDRIANTIKRLNFAFNAINSLASMEGVKFDKLDRLDVLLTPHLQSLLLVENHLVSLGDVTQYSWGSLLPRRTYMVIYLRQNPWHCNGSLIWMSSNLYRFEWEIIHAKHPLKPYIGDVSQLLCERPDTRCGTTVVPVDVIESVNITIHSLRNLACKYNCHFSSNIKWNFTNVKSLIIFHSNDGCYLHFHTNYQHVIIITWKSMAAICITEKENHIAGWIIISLPLFYQHLWKINTDVMGDCLCWVVPGSLRLNIRTRTRLVCSISVQAYDVNTTSTTHHCWKCGMVQSPTKETSNTSGGDFPAIWMFMVNAPPHLRQ